MTSIKAMGNPFIDESADLHVLYYNDILQDTVVRTIGNIETLGEKLHSEYVEQTLIDTTTPISHPLSKQQLPIFSKRVARLRLLHNLKLLILNLKSIAN